MFLNYEQIKEKGIIINANDNNYGNGSYTIKVGEIITVDGKQHDSFSIEPQGMVILISNESFNLPLNVIGNATIKNSISNSGLLAINIGIVDPGYNGHISSTLINFGKNSYDINKGTDFIRLTFHEFVTPNKVLPVPDDINVTKEKYIKRKKNDARIYLDETFLSLNTVEKKIRKNVTETIVRYGFAISIAVTTIALLFSLYFNYLNKDYKKDEEKYKLMKEQITNSNQILQEVKNENKDIKNELYKINSKINQTKKP